MAELHGEYFWPRPEVVGMGVAEKTPHTGNKSKNREKMPTQALAEQGKDLG